MEKYAIGLDFGTDSVRALLVNAHTGEEIITAVHNYQRWQEGKYCDSQQSRFRQHPLDYLEGMEAVIKEVLENVSVSIRENVTGIGVATTGSTPVAVDKQGTPLALLSEFSNCPDAMFILWKDHTASAEAEEINAMAHQSPTDYTCYSGGIYSPEWFWSKILHITRTNEAVVKEAFSWVEHCDWIPAVLTGNTDPLTIKRSRCAAGHKAMWHESFGGLPEEAFWKKLDQRLVSIRQQLYSHTYTADQPAGIISREWADKLNLSENTTIATGAIDAHFGAVGSGIKPYTMAKIIGTSTCDMVTVPAEESDGHLVKGICGQVDGSIIPGMLGLEAGQSAFGDLYSWFVQVLMFPIREFLSKDLSSDEINCIANTVLSGLSEKAATLPVTENDVVALDWINGRRTPDADLTLKGAIAGIHLGTGAPQLFKALVEATAFGSKAIVKRFQEEGIPINKIIASGGIAKKSPYVMQVLANILNMPISVVNSDQVCALGAAMFSATASGIYATVQEAQEAMASGFDTEYLPQENKTKIYERLYLRYNTLGKTIGSI